MPKDDAIDQMSRVKQDVRARMDAAVAAIVALCWDYRSPDFSFSNHLTLLRQVNKILSEMSDGILSDSEKRAVKALAEAELQDYENDAIEYAEGEINGEGTLFRLDRQADHLRDLIAGWLAVAAFVGLSKSKMIQNFWTFLGNVSASKDWRESGRKVPSWGRGFPIDILTGMTVIGQDLINRASQFARIKSFRARGAIGYRTIRQSSYDCPLCDEMCEKVWTFADEIPLPYHPRCVCKAVPVYESDTRKPLPKDALDKSRNEAVTYGKENLIGKTMIMEGIDRPVTFTVTGIKEAANQPHRHFIEKNDAIKNILTIGPLSSLIKESIDDKRRNYLFRYYRTTIAGDDSFIIIRENLDTKLIDFYSIVDRIKE